MATIFITGASSGLGLATAKLFATNGWRVVGTVRQPEPESELAKLPGATVLALDVTDPAQIEATVTQALALGDIDVVFNNAGYMLAGPLEGTTDEQLTSQVNTNLLGPIRVAQAFLPHFRTRGTGLFITTTSFGAWVPEPFMAVYGATKRALEAWSEGMYFELSRFGISSKTLIPGFMKTNLVGSAAVVQQPAYADLLNQVLGVFTDPAAATNAATPEQIAPVVWEAATDGKNQLHYFAGAEASQRYAHLQAVGPDAVRQEMTHRFFGD